MSGAGRHHKGKHILQQMDDCDVTLGANEIVGRCGIAAGNDQFEVELTDGTVVLGKLPRRLHKIVWLQRGDVLVVASIEEGTTVALGAKSATEIVRKLMPEQVKGMVKSGQIPPTYAPPAKPTRELPPMPSADSEGSEEDLT